MQLEVGERLLAAFDTPSKLPYSFINLGQKIGHQSAWDDDWITAELTSIQLEFRELSRATGISVFEVKLDLKLTYCRQIFI